MCKQPRWWSGEPSKPRPRHRHNNGTKDSTESIFSPDEVDIIERFRRFQNNPGSLLKLAIPCLFTIAACPFAIFMVDPMWDFFYPFDDSRKGNINSTLSAFLVPASLVYSLVWGFALQDAFSKFDVTDANAKTHMSLLKQIRELMMRCGVFDITERRQMSKQLCRCTTSWMSRQMGDTVECKGETVIY